MKSGKRVLYAVQNAVTGEMWADIPMDISRFALVTLAIAAVLYLVFNSFLTLRPEMVMIAAMLLAIFAQLAVNGRREKMGEKQLAEAVVRGETVNVDDRMAKMKKLEARVKRQKNGGIFRYLGALGTGAAAVIALNMLSGILAATTFGTVYVASRKMAKKYGQPLNKIDISIEKIMNYASKGLDIAEKHFDKPNELDKMLDKAEENE